MFWIYILGRLNIHLRGPSCEEVKIEPRNFVKSRVRNTTVLHEFDVATIRIQENTHIHTEDEALLSSESSSCVSFVNVGRSAAFCVQQCNITL